MRVSFVSSVVIYPIIYINEWDQLSMHNKHSNGMPPRIDASAGRGKSTCEYFLGDIVGKKYS